MSERVYDLTGERYTAAEQTTLDLKGKSQPVAVRVVDLNVNVTA